MRRSCERTSHPSPRAGVPGPLFLEELARTAARPSAGASVVALQGGGRSEEALDSMEGRNWAAEVHVGPLQLVAALSTHLQLLRGQLGTAEADRVDHLLEITAAATGELRELMARLEPPAEGQPLLAGLSGSARRVLGAEVVVVDGTDGSLAAPVRSAVLALTHTALVEMRRSGAQAPGRMEVTHRDGEVTVRIVLSSGGAVTRQEPTLVHRARLAGGSAGVAVTSGQVIATIGLPGA